MARPPKGPKSVETLTHDEATRKNIPTAELQSFLQRQEEAEPLAPVAYPRARPLAPGETRERDGDLDPQIIWNGLRITLTAGQRQQLVETGQVEIGDAQLVWRGKDTQDWSDLVVQAPPLYIQEKIHPKAIIEDLKKHTAPGAAPADTLDLFADFNGIDPEAKTEFYAHDQHWSNRMILGDSLQVMASLAERERLAGKVQCIYFDPPYGIKFNSNWQVSTQSRDVKDGKQTDISREPEQVKAFRDTWKDGIHSYLTYLRDRLTVMRELLTESGSVFVQISEENVHRVRAVMDEVFGEENFIVQIVLKKTGTLVGEFVESINDYIIWFAKDKRRAKYRKALGRKLPDSVVGYQYVEHKNGVVESVSAFDGNISDVRLYGSYPLHSQGFRNTTTCDFYWFGQKYHPGASNNWKVSVTGLTRAGRADRLIRGDKVLRLKRYFDDFLAVNISNNWQETFTASDKIYVVQTAAAAVQRCILMASDPGDLVLDPTCGSGTTAYVAEQWGRRWVTIDTSRVALALARTRLMSARYPFYLLADSPEGRKKEQEVSGRSQPQSGALGDIRQGFVYERVPHVMLKSIADNAEIDVIWEQWQAVLEPLRAQLNGLLGKAWEEWEIPREIAPHWPEEAKVVHAKWWEARIGRQKEIDASIARRADVELLYDRPYEDKGRVRVAGPFTVESLSPHRMIPSDEDTLVGDLDAAEGRRKRNPVLAGEQDFSQVVLENLKTAGVQQSTKAEKIVFTALTPWPGEYVGAEGRFLEGEVERRAAIFIGPEFGTVARADLVAAAREAVDARFDVLIAAAFNFEAHTGDLQRMGPLPIIKAKINPDMHMAGELKNTGKGNLFIVFGEPDVDIEPAAGDQVQVRVKGVDVFDPNTGDIRSGDTKSIAAWFIDTDYDEESFFVRHAYFLGANDPYKSLKTALRAEIDEAAWATLYRDVSRPFDRPKSGRIAVKVINHFGDEVMKVFRV